MPLQYHGSTASTRKAALNMFSRIAFEYSVTIISIFVISHFDDAALRLGIHTPENTILGAFDQKVVAQKQI